MKKIITALLSMALLLCCVSCTLFEGNASDTYDNIIEQYRSLLIQKQNGEELEKAKDGDEIGVALYEIANKCSDVSLMGYATKDINRDGIEELVLMGKDSLVYALFTQKNGRPVLLYYTTGLSFIDSEGTVGYGDFQKDEYDKTFIQKIVDGKLVGIEVGMTLENGVPSYYKIENGARSESTPGEKNNYDHEFFSAPEKTKRAGFRFIPAIPSDNGQSPYPAADFSSYDSILSAYRTIVGSFSDYSHTKWVNGDFDTLFTFNDNETYEIFNSIFDAGIRYKPTKTYFGDEYAENGDNAYGYTIKDINGDGVEELILLTDGYDILALFTMKDGRAVWLREATGAWIDEYGKIRTSKWMGGMVDRDGEYYVYTIGDGKLDLNIGVGFKVNFYLEKEGYYRTDGYVTAPVSDEEGVRMYAEYDALPDGYQGNEYMKDVSRIGFTPLFDSAFAANGHLDTFERRYYNGSEFITVTAIEGNSVAFTMDLIKLGEPTDPDDPFSYEVITTQISGEGELEGEVYTFDADGFKGYLDFNVRSIWVVITESNSENVSPRSYLFDYPQNNLG